MIRIKCTIKDKYSYLLYDLFIAWGSRIRIQMSIMNVINYHSFVCLLPRSRRGLILSRIFIMPKKIL